MKEMYREWTLQVRGIYSGQTLYVCERNVQGTDTTCVRNVQGPLHYIICRAAHKNFQCACLMSINSLTQEGSNRRSRSLTLSLLSCVSSCLFSYRGFQQKVLTEYQSNTYTSSVLSINSQSIQLYTILLHSIQV